jgi:hypothetical protein
MGFVARSSVCFDQFVKSEISVNCSIHFIIGFMKLQNTVPKRKKIDQKCSKTIT